jgi:hypothetical protein
MRALNAGYFAEQSPFVFIDHHHSILPGDKQTMVWRIGDHIVPAPVPA